jgi:hypothetical protein
MKYTIRLVDNKLATEIVIRNHYLHRRAPCSIAFGLFDGCEIIGVIMYGTPSSAPLRSGICGPDFSMNVIELTRLWIKDGTQKNSESYLIGNTLRRCGKEIVVSYAEIDEGHVGTVYQATNWIYTGLSAKRTNWTIDGDTRHCQTLADQYTSSEIRNKYGASFSLVDRPRKHRYIYFNCGPRRRKYLLSMLRYPVLPYPKR